ncbi:MAG: hypothetical protein M3487_00710 [Actinomycetota bacterium]|nr:hypothetical protein [Actinomycetota bacterium]
MIEPSGVAPGGSPSAGSPPTDRAITLSVAASMRRITPSIWMEWARWWRYQTIAPTLPNASRSDPEMAIRGTYGSPLSRRPTVYSPAVA